jgi:hypothetical protein
MEMTTVLDVIRHRVASTITTYNGTLMIFRSNS